MAILQEKIANGANEEKREWREWTNGAKALLN
jgi:hypothetical protein